MAKIFVSHSSEDKKIIDSFVSNILRLGLHIDESYIFCTSSEGMGIKSGEKWREAIQEEMNLAKVVLLMISPNYKASEICLNEMGAAWISDATVIPLMMGDITYDSVGVIIEPRQIEKIDETGLDHLHDALVKEFPDIKKKIKTSVWNSKKRLFLNDFKKIEKENPFPQVFSMTEMKKKIKEHEDLQKDFDELLESKEKLEEIIEKLKKCKDANEVEKIEQEYTDTSILDEFEELILTANIALQKVSPSVRTIIYNKRYKRELSIDYNANNELQEAIAKNFIEDTGEGYEPLYEKRTMHEIRNSIDAIENFINELDEDGTDTILKKYEAIDVGDLDFWTDVMKVTLSYKNY